MNFKNRTLFIADNLDIMRGINSETIDLIYLDPPFNSKKQYKAPIGSPAQGAEFKDIWTDEDIKHEWVDQLVEDHEHLYKIIQACQHLYDNSMMIYLMAMSIRLIEMHRILKPTGSIYLHCDPTASHYLKLVMDSLFGKQNFRNEIVWHYQAGTKGSYRFGQKHDLILLNAIGIKNTFNRQSKPVKNPKRYRYTDENGDAYDVNGQGKRYYLKIGATCDDVWTWTQELQFQSLNSQAKERTGWSTQKPLALLDRIIKASSNENDIILDPFCGCATACVAAERLNRQWVGIDISPSAEVITKYRLDEASEQGTLFSPIKMSDITATSEPPTRTDKKRLPPPNTHKQDLYGKQQGICTGCKDHFKLRNLTIDHIMPKVRGGTDHVNNLQLLCNACNSTKGTRSQDEFIKKLIEQGIVQSSNIIK